MPGHHAAFLTALSLITTRAISKGNVAAPSSTGEPHRVELNSHSNLFIRNIPSARGSRETIRHDRSSGLSAFLHSGFAAFRAVRLCLTVRSLVSGGYAFVSTIRGAASTNQCRPERQSLSATKAAKPQQPVYQNIFVNSGVSLNVCNSDRLQMRSTAILLRQGLKVSLDFCQFGGEH